MLDSLSIRWKYIMQSYLYQDLYTLEEIHWWHRAKRELISSVLKRNFNKERKILDVGCGTGKNLETFSRFGTAWGIDISQEAINFCKKRGLNNVLLGNITKIPFPKHHFDYVTALDVLEHVDDTKALTEIYRVLRPEGIVIITVPAFPKLWSRWDDVLFHKRRYTKFTLKKVLRKNGFIVSQISYTYSFLYLPALVIRWVKSIIYRDHYPSDFRLSNPLINSLLSFACLIERLLILHINIPFGTSIIAVARK